MRRIIISFIIALILSGCGQQKYVTTKWEKQSYKAIDSIPVMDYSYDAKGKLFYMVTNDSTTLYVHLKAVDESAQKKILMQGLNIWIDTTARNKKQMCVKFPLPANERKGNVLNDIESQMKRRDFGELKSREIDQLKEIELVGFSGKNSSQIVSAISNSSVSVNIEVNGKGDLLYLLTIPYKSLGIEYKPDMYLSLLLKSGHLPENMRPGEMTGSRPGGMSGGGSGGAGGHSGNMGGGPPGGMRDGGNPQMQQKSQAQQQLATPINIQLKKVKLL